MARARAFSAHELDAARAFVAQLGSTGDGVVLKQDGLAGGKGVTVYDDVALAIEHVPSFLAGRDAWAGSTPCRCATPWP